MTTSDSDRADDERTTTYMDLAEFRDRGYLQEVNRLVLHPCGLALEWHPGWTRDELSARLRERGIQFGSNAIENAWTGIVALGLDRPHLSGVWDYRADPEGVVFRAAPDVRKSRNVRVDLGRHAKARIRLFGSVIQEPGRGVPVVKPS